MAWQPRTFVLGGILLLLIVIGIVVWSSGPDTQVDLTFQLRPQARGQQAIVVFGSNRGFDIDRFWVVAVDSKNAQPDYDDPENHTDDPNLKWCWVPGDAPSHVTAIQYGRTPNGYEVLAPLNGLADPLETGQWYLATMDTNEGTARCWFQTAVFR